MTPLRSLAVLAVALAALSSCTSIVIDENDPALATEELYKLAGTQLWPDGVVGVCWEAGTYNNSSYATVRANTRTWLAESVSDVANITFTGWGLCPTPANNQMALRIDPSQGNYSVTAATGWQGANAINEIAFGSHIFDPFGSQFVIHEFLHAVGFEHEANRPDRPAPCGNEPTYPGGTSYGNPYDVNSVSNLGYCGTQNGLTQWDRAGLTAAYGTFGSKRLSAFPNQDGRIELAWNGTANVLYHKWQNAKNSTNWEPPRLLANPLNAAKRHNLNRNQDGRLELFYIGTNDTLYHNYQTTVNSAWGSEALMGVASNKAKELTSAINTNGKLELVYIGTNNQLYYMRQNTASGAWGGETQLGSAAATASQVAIGKNPDGRLEVFYTTTSNMLFHVWQTSAGGSWSGHSALGNGSYAAKRLAVANHADGRLAVFYIGTDNRVYLIEQTNLSGAWGSQQNVNSTSSYGTELAVGRNPDGRLEVFYAGLNNVLWHVWQNSANGSWSTDGWVGTGSTAGKQLAVGTNADGHLELIYVGTNDTLYHAWYDGSAWVYDIAF